MRLLALIKTLFLLGVLAIIGTIVAVAVFGLDNSALVTVQPELTTANVQRARQLIKQHSPEKMKAGEERGYSVREDDLNLVFRYLLARVPGGKGFGTRIDIESRSVALAATAKLPDNPFRSYLNLSVNLVQEGSATPTLKSIRLGAIELPSWAIKPALPIAHQLLSRFGGYADLTEAAGAIREYRLEKDALFLEYQWQPEVVERMKQRGREVLLSAEDRQLLGEYNAHLATVVRNLKAKKISLSDLLVPLFKFARERNGTGGDPGAENRAAITVLAMYTLKKPVSLIAGEQDGGTTREPKHVTVTLRGRNDLAKHFMLSAAIAALSDSNLANAIGLFKELDDSRGGSGFSFADLAADRAGVRFAEIGTGDDHHARLLQERIAAATGEGDFMPTIDKLPEGMQEMAFKQRFSNLDSKAYGAVKSEIEQRISACRLFK